MHSYKNLAVLTLAASAISPALAAPVVGVVGGHASRDRLVEAELPTLKSRNHARVELNAKRSFLSDLGKGVGSYLNWSIFGGSPMTGALSKILHRNEGDELDSLIVEREEPSLGDYLLAINADHGIDQRDGPDTRYLLQVLNGLNKRTADDDYSTKDLVEAIKHITRALDGLD